MWRTIHFWIPIFMLSGAAPAFTDDMQPTPKQAESIEAHASSWDLVLQREHLRHLVTVWNASTAVPDSAAACFDRMRVVADAVVDRIVLATGYSRGVVMRWLEADIGLKPYFFPPGPEGASKQDGIGLWTFLRPLLPILVYRVVDRVID